MTIDIPELVRMVTKALRDADADCGDGMPDYDVLAEAAVKVVLEQVAKVAIGEAVQEGSARGT